MKEKIGTRPDDGAWIHSELDDFGLTASEFRVYCHILRRAGTNGSYWEGAKKAAAICRINRDTYDKAIAALGKYNMIEVQKRTGETSIINPISKKLWTKGTGNQGEGTGNQGEGTGNQGEGTGNQGEGTGNQGEGIAKSRAPETRATGKEGDPLPGKEGDRTCPNEGDKVYPIEGTPIEGTPSLKEERETRAREKNSEPVENPSMGNPIDNEPDYATQPIAITNGSTSKTNSSAAPPPAAKELPPWRLSWEPQDYEPDFCRDVLRRMQKQWPERTLGDAIAKISNAEAANKTKQIASDYDAFRFPKSPPPNQPACIPVIPTIPQPMPPDPLDQHLAHLGWSKTRAIQHMIEHHGWPDILTQTGTLRSGNVFNWQAIGARAEQLHSAIAALIPTDQGDLIAEYEATLLRAGMSKREAIAHMVEIGLWDKACSPEALTDSEINQIIDAVSVRSAKT
jgi:hypothetical protein